MDFVDEEDGISFRGKESAMHLRFLNHFAHFLHSRSDGTQGEKWHIECLGNDVGKGGFSHAWRSPQNK